MNALVRSVSIDGVELVLGTPVTVEMDWTGEEWLLEQVMAAWATIHEADVPLCPRILGHPGVGKTTLACAAAKRVNKHVHVMQCTSDTRPEDLLVVPVLGSKQEIRYHASPLVTAMIEGGACILDEGNRMPEKAWASLAPLLDHRRYVESIITGTRIKAHPDFRICVTMNQDASVFEIPDYIGSRLKPKIHVPFPSPDDEKAILRYNIPFARQEVIDYVVDFLQKARAGGETYSPRDGINIARYMLKLSFHEGELDATRIPAYFKTAAARVLDEAAVGYVDGVPRKARPGFLDRIGASLAGASQLFPGFRFVGGDDDDGDEGRDEDGDDDGDVDWDGNDVESGHGGEHEPGDDDDLP